MHKHFLWSFIAVTSFSCAAIPLKTSRYLDSASIYPSALRGNLRPVLDEFKQIPDSSLSPVQLQLKQSYLSRFSDTPSDTSPHTPSNTTLVSGFAGEVLLAHEVYWRRVLLQNISTEDGYRFWFDRLSELAAKRGRKFGPFGEQEAENLAEYIAAELKKEGYFSRLGRTKPHLDLLLWKKQDHVRYTIDLGDTVITVPVIMMDDFITFGWLGFATFNEKHTGGWADRDQLYCVKPAYDLESEEFRISYLAHEGRHFSDYKNFPALGAADLEYRAKLTELSLAKVTVKDLVERFNDEAANDPSSSHAYASYALVKELSEKLATELDPHSIQNLSDDRIREAAAILLTLHTKQLERLGTKSTKGVFHSP